MKLIIKTRKFGLADAYLYTNVAMNHIKKKLITTMFIYIRKKIPMFIIYTTDAFS